MSQAGRTKDSLGLSQQVVTRKEPMFYALVGVVATAAMMDKR